MEFLLALVGGSIGAAVVGGGFSVIIWKLNRRATKEDKRECFTDGVRILLYDRIKHLAKSYIARGYITSEELEDLIEMHKIYHDSLKGNGFLDNVMKQVYQLPIIN